MSYLVLHMDKFKRESLRGIQSHNRRERRSHSNPDIRHEKSGENCDLHQPEVCDYARAVQAREAERYLSRNEELPEATLFNFKTVLAQARRVIEEQKKALAEKAILEGRKQIADGLLVDRKRELKEQARRIDRLLQELEEVKAQKNKTEGEARAFKEFIAQPEEKLRFEQFLTDKQEEARRAEMERQNRLTSCRSAPASEDDWPSFSPR